MGIRGLSTFFSQNPNLSQSYELHDTSVIIDGRNLVHFLYFTNKIDCICGGDYNKLYLIARNYLELYIKCNIRPIIIFDGGYDKSDRKLNTVLQRTKQRLTLVQLIAKYGMCSENILPIFAYEIFQDVLHDINIPFAQCDYEADNQITALANIYNCPVISNDSDFYIFNIYQGFIRLDSIDSYIHFKKNNEEFQYNYLKCNFYHIDSFLTHFPGIDKNVLPLFGTLIGNDFVHINTFKNFFSHIKLPKFKSRNLKLNERQRKILGVLNWLKDIGLNEGMNNILNSFKKEQRNKIKTIIDSSISGYSIYSSNLTFIIENKMDEMYNNLQFNNTLITSCNMSVPVYFAMQFHLGNFPPLFINALNLHRIILPSQVEDVALKSSYECSGYIRQIIYGILLQHSNSELNACKNANCSRPIEEYDRRNGRLQKNYVEPIFSIKTFGYLPALNNLENLKHVDAKNLIAEVLEENLENVIQIPEKWKLLFLSIKYWLKKSELYIIKEFIFAVILNLLYFDVLIKHDSSKDSNNQPKQDPNFQKYLKFEIDEVRKYISPEVALFGAKNIKKYYHKPQINNKNPLIILIIHLFSELQTCILYSLYLNKLLGFPFIQPKMHQIASGTLIYNLTKELISRKFPILFIAQMLGRETALDAFFIKIKDHLMQNIPKDRLSTEIEVIHFKKKSKSKVKKDKLKIQTCSFNKTQAIDYEFNNKFNYLDLIED